MVLVVLGALQIVVVGGHQLAVEAAAREGARAAAVSADPVTAGRAAAAGATSLGPLDVAVATSATRVTVTVRYHDPTDVAMAGRLIGDVTLTATATMQLEPP